jgi:tRNA nucleotidyltransferase (CCA-adding enzyme)
VICGVFRAERMRRVLAVFNRLLDAVQWSETAVRSRAVKFDKLLSEEEKELFEKLAQIAVHPELDCTVRIAGGWVRDRLLGIEGNRDDIDISVDRVSGVEFCNKTQLAMPDVKLAILKTNPALSKHLETVTLKIDNFALDVVQLRRDQYTNASRIPIVNVAPPHEDAMRRDLTINALFYNIATKQIEDFTGKGESLCRTRLRVCKADWFTCRT